jgi:hypothetical protein
MAVRNLSQHEVTFTLAAADGYFTATGRFNMLPSTQVSTAAGTWIDLPSEVTVAAGGTAVIPFTITVPSNATPGDHPAGVAASVVSAARASGGSQVGVESRVGFRVITRVTGDLVPALVARDLTIAYEYSWNPFWPGTVTWSYEAENTGNTQLSFFDQYGAGEPVDRGDLFPGEVRQIEARQAGVWPLVLVLATVHVQPEPTGDIPRLNPIELRAPAWALPWPQLAALVILTAAVTVIVTVRRRHRRHLEQLLSDARAQGRRDVRGSVEVGSAHSPDPSEEATS